jgi:hypothetical protein
MRMGLCSTVVPGYDATGGLIVRVFSEGTAARVRSAPTDSFPILSHFPITVLCPGEQINVFQLLFEAPTTDARYRPDGGGLVCICSPHQTNPPPLLWGLWTPHHKPQPTNVGISATANTSNSALSSLKKAAVGCKLSALLLT